MVNLENPENQTLNAHFSLHLLKQCYNLVDQNISISEIKRVYVFSYLPDINATLKIVITIT